MKPLYNIYGLIHISLFIVLFLSQCQNQKSPEKEPDNISIDDIIGEWSNLSMNVTFMENDSVFNVPEGKWKQLLKIKPIITQYNADYTYISKYYSLDDSLLFTTEGTWSISADSLHLTSEGVTTAYHFTLDKNIGTFKGVLDWDADGDAKEIYRGRQRKQSSKHD